MMNREGIRDKQTIKIIISRVLEVDGTNSMEKIISYEILDLGTVEECMEKVKKLLEEAKKHEFRFLGKEDYG